MARPLDSCCKAARAAAKDYRRKATFYNFVGVDGTLMAKLRAEAANQLRSAEGGECAQTLREALACAEEVGVDREAIGRGESPGSNRRPSLADGICCWLLTAPGRP